MKILENGSRCLPLSVYTWAELLQEIDMRIVYFIPRLLSSAIWHDSACIRCADYRACNKFLFVTAPGRFRAMKMATRG